MRQRIAIDMDEVLVDTVTRRLALYAAEFGEELAVEKLHGLKIYDAVPEAHRPGVLAQLTTAGFFRDLPPMPGALFVLGELMEKYEIFIATAAMEYPNSFTEKYEWIKEHLPLFPDSHIVFCGDKSIICADYLIDDTPHHFARFSGQGILFTASHNVHETRYPRVDHWSDVRKRFLGEPLE
jgi:5'(3')-deoxyribonucleotidase